MTKNRDDFSKGTKEILAKRVGYLCSNLTCRKPTIGPNEDIEKSTSIGIASHITAASKGGPRFNEKLSPELRKHYDNAIWLCSNCATLIDKDFHLYTEDTLKNWKQTAEDESRKNLSGNLKTQEFDIPILDIYLKWGSAFRAPMGYSDKNPKRIQDGKEYIDVSNTPIIYWSVSRTFSLIIYNNSKYPAFNLKIDSIGENHFEYLNEFEKINNLPPLEKTDLEGEFKDFVEGIHTDADKIMEDSVPLKLKNIELKITFYNDLRHKFVNLIQFTEDGLSNTKL